MEYKLRNGKTVIIRKPTINDAKGIIDIISTADSETKFLASVFFCPFCSEANKCRLGILAQHH